MATPDVNLRTGAINSGAVVATDLANGAIIAAKLGTDAVETAKIKDLNVTTGKIAAGAVTVAKLATDAVETVKIKDLNVTTGKLAAEAVTEAKVQAGAAAAGLSGLVVKFSANVDVIGAIPVLHRIDVADATGNTDVVLTHKTMILDAWALNTGIAAHAANDTWQLKNSANAISDAVAKTATVNAIKRVGTMNPTYTTIAAGGTLRVAAVKDTNAAVTVFVLGVRVA